MKEMSDIHHPHPTDCCCCCCCCCRMQSRGLDADAAQEVGMKEMSEVFKAAGAQVYLPADEATA